MVTVMTNLRDSVGSVVDPEIPVLTVEDLGVLRSVEVDGDRVLVTITPTYSGCPAMRQIEHDIAAALEDAGVDEYEIVVSQYPAWTTDWITAEGRDKLARFGIAPPGRDEDLLCPRCRSASPREVSRFGSTACKALMVCTSCGDPFDRFKEF
jgi:ring-1,2-phenylacetyl-CoA epoxidase subunit PaaD